MDRIRLIIYGRTDGAEEGVVFTDDYKCPATDWCAPGWVVIYDKIITSELPHIFPLNYFLKKED